MDINKSYVYKLTRSYFVGKALTNTKCNASFIAGCRVQPPTDQNPYEVIVVHINGGLVNNRVCTIEGFTAPNLKQSKPTEDNR